MVALVLAVDVLAVVFVLARPASPLEPSCQPRYVYAGPLAPASVRPDAGPLWCREIVRPP
jgi:hypothetical protein